MTQALPNLSNAAASRDWVLVVDDEAPLRRMVAEFLQETDVEVVGAESGPAALAILAGRPDEPVLALVDVLLPGMDGLTLTRKLRTQLKRSAFVIMSGHLTALDWWPVDLREVAFLPKPFRLAEITRIVAAARAGFRREG